MLKGLGGLGDLAQMMKAATEMQSKMAELHEKLTHTVVLGESGGGLVRARVTAKGNLTGLEIDPSLFVASEKEVVEDLIVAAVHEAQANAALRSQLEMTRLTEDMGLPAGMKLPF